MLFDLPPGAKHYGALTAPKTGPQRQENDFYPTPAPVTEALCAAESLPQDVWEPACGDGAISKVLESRGHSVISTDLIYRGYGEGERDFFKERKLLAPAIVTNPPFKLSEAFAVRALELGAGVVCFLQRLAWLEGVSRLDNLWRLHPPASVWVLARRPTLWRGDVEDAPTSGGSVAMAWFVWRAGCSDCRIGWIDTASSQNASRNEAQPSLFADPTPDLEAAYQRSLFAEAAE